VSDSSAGYVTDVEYTGSYFPFLAPAALAYIAVIKGSAAPRADAPFTWCELGCGKGLTPLVLAATHPGGKFYGCDFNSSHVEYADRLRQASGLENASFYPRSFAGMLAEELPPFDFIVLHGVYSWVPESARAEILDFVRMRLKPGGLCMVSYNAMPGWAHLQPIRRMMRDHAASVPGDSIARARAAFAYVEQLANNGALYFRTLPAAAEHLKGMARRDIRYVAHEYMTPHGDPFYFSEVEGAMAGAGLAFAGSMLAPDNYPELMAPEPFRALLTGPRTQVEMHRDVIANTSFRKDLYAAQPPVAQPRDIPLRAFDGLSFCLTDLPETLPLRRAEGGLQFDLGSQAGAVRAVHHLLSSGPASAAEIHRAAGLHAEEETSFLIQQLVVAAHLAPAPGMRPGRRWLQVNSALIAAGLREQWQEAPLAGTATGSASYSEIIHAAVIEAAARFDSAEAAAKSVLGQVRGHAHPVTLQAPGGEKRPAADHELLDYASLVWRNLRNPESTDGRRLRLLGILP
jgi:predicted O-methyltransferase YrrM